MFGILVQYSFDGYLHMIFYSQDFDILDTGMKISGKEILAQLFHNKNVNAWGMIGVLIAYIALFRLVHYGLFLYVSMPFLGAGKATEPAEEAGSGGGSAKLQARYEGVQQAEVELV